MRTRPDTTFAAEAAAVGGRVTPALEEAEVPACLLGDDGRVRAVNHAAVELLGHSQGLALAELVAHESRTVLREHLARTLLRRTAVTFDVVLRGPQRRRVRVTAIAMVDGDVAVGVVALLHPLGRSTAGSGAYRLTARQRQVLGCLAAGATTNQIAARLSISPETVRNHVRGILRALGVNSRLQAAAVALREGIVEL